MGVGLKDVPRCVSQYMPKGAPLGQRRSEDCPKGATTKGGYVIAPEGQIAKNTFSPLLSDKEAGPKGILQYIEPSGEPPKKSLGGNLKIFEIFSFS